MARIEVKTEKNSGWFGRLVYWFSRKRLGKVAEPLGVMAHHQKLLFGYGMFELAVQGSNRVPPRLKELAGLKTAALIGCEFCLDIASYLARNSGVSEAELMDLNRHRQSQHFSDLDKLSWTMRWP
jgi:AhpD family alkylhydroperoxidase